MVTNLAHDPLTNDPFDPVTS